MNASTIDFVRSHRKDDVRQLAFLGKRFPEVDMPWALDQIRGWQMAKEKLPTWAAKDGMVYPPHLSMEQCSSEQTARYKTALVSRWLQLTASAERREEDSGKKTVLVDLTGGFGVDFSFLAPLFDEATYVEQQAHLCDVALHNFEELALRHATVKNSDSIDFLQSVKHVTTLFIDPARRDEHGRKTYSIKDCTPDVAQLCPTLLSKCDFLVIKLSPMLDWHEAVRELQAVREVHIVSVANECKELLLVCSNYEQPQRLFCVNDGQEFVCDLENQGSLTSLPLLPASGILPGSILLVPNASIMKAGCFAALCNALQVAAVSPNSHLFFATENNGDSVLFERFPGRVFRVEQTCTLNKKDLKTKLSHIERANVAVRNFPLTADQLRKKLKLKDGGDVYVFGTTLQNGEHILIITKKVR